MKIYIAFVIPLILWSCQKKNSIENRQYPFFVGTYTNTGTSQGIYRYLLDKDGGLKRIGLASKIENPSFLAFSSNKKFLLAVSEINRDNTGTISSFLISGDSLLFMNQSSSGGADPCFVSVNNNGYVLVANYTGGNVGLLRLNAKGELSPLLDVEKHIGFGTTEQQQSPHAHSVWFEPVDNKIISVDLGTNQLWFSRLDTALNILVPSNTQTLNLNLSAGPRHLVFHPNGKWIYVVNELDCTVTKVFRFEDGKYEMGSSVSTLPEGYSEPNACADIHISSNGEFLYASNRGHNSIAIFQVDESNGDLKLIGHQPTNGDWPRNFSLSPDENYLLVANQNTNNIVSFKRDKTTGLLEYVSQVEAPSPVCILF